MTQTALGQFTPTDPVWQDLVMSRDGAAPEFTHEVKALRRSRGDRPMTAHLCAHSFTDSRLYSDRGDPLFTGYCRLRHGGDASLPTYCKSQFWPWYLCPCYRPREASE